MITWRLLCNPQGDLLGLECMDQKNFVRENPIFALMKNSGHSPADLSPAFPEMSLEEIILMLMDNRFGLRRTVERFGYLGIRECRSDFFNIDKNGRRSIGSNSSLRNGDLQVYCYGGSTTVGQNVADNQTISAYLESQLREKLNVSVSNFGAGNHTSLHSSLRLLDHALSGNVPDLAIFLNGFNDCSYSGGGADGVLPFLGQLLESSQDLKGRETKLSEFTRLIPHGSSQKDYPRLSTDIQDEDLINTVRTHYELSVTIQNFVAKHFDVRILRFIEPTVFLNCRPEQFLLSRIGLGNMRFELVKRLYTIIGEHGCAKVFGNADFVPLVDIGQDRLSEPLFVDEAHFSPKFNEVIAEKISAHVKFSRRDLSGKQKRLRTKEITGNISEVVNQYNYPLF